MSPSTPKLTRLQWASNVLPLITLGTVLAVAALEVTTAGAQLDRLQANGEASLARAWCTTASVVTLRNERTCETPAIVAPAVPEAPAPGLISL